jgi:chloramphenicol-sensitive protein RarD
VAIMGTNTTDTVLLLAAGVASTTPLILFTAAARKLAYSTLGMLQFIAPTLQFLIAVALYGEPFTTAHAIAFPAIWIALLLYVTAMLRAPRLPQAPE